MCSSLLSWSSENCCPFACHPNSQCNGTSTTSGSSVEGEYSSFMAWLFPQPDASCKVNTLKARALSPCGFEWLGWCIAGQCAWRLVCFPPSSGMGGASAGTIKVAAKHCGRLRSKTYSQQMSPEMQDALSSVWSENNHVTGGAVVVEDMERWALLLVPDRLYSTA